jgi:aspartate ammonia-lyase
MSNQQFHVEYALPGERQVPQDAYYGVHTLREKPSIYESLASFVAVPVTSREQGAIAQ